MLAWSKTLQKIIESILAANSSLVLRCTQCFLSLSSGVAPGIEYWLLPTKCFVDGDWTKMLDGIVQKSQGMERHKIHSVWKWPRLYTSCCIITLAPYFYTIGCNRVGIIVETMSPRSCLSPRFFGEPSPTHVYHWHS